MSSQMTGLKEKKPERRSTDSYKANSEEDKLLEKGRERERDESGGKDTCFRLSC